MIAHANQANSDMLPDLFSNLLYYGVYPDEWKIAKCVTISKPGRSDGSNPKNHCPISLLPCLGKTVEKILVSRIAIAGKTLGAITNAQFDSLAEQSPIDTLTINTTRAQRWTKVTLVRANTESDQP